MKVPVLIPRIFDHPHTYLSGRFGKLKAGSIVMDIDVKGITPSKLNSIYK